MANKVVVAKKRDKPLLPGPEFRWRTMDGQVLALSEMETSHCFNSMKMVFNHLAAAHGGQPVWFEKTYKLYQRECPKKPLTYGALVIFFMQEIDRRGDLPAKYHEPYEEIKRQIYPLALAAGFQLNDSNL